MAPVENKKWYIIRGAVRQGPLSIIDLQRRLETQSCTLDDTVWCAGMAQARPIRNIEELHILCESPSVISAAISRLSGDQEEDEKTMVAQKAPPRSATLKPQNPDNERTIVMTPSERASISKRPPAPDPVIEEKPKPKSEPEEIRSYEIESDSSPRVSSIATFPPKIEVKRVEETPAPDPEPEPEPISPPSFEPGHESLAETPEGTTGSGLSDGEIKFTNPFVMQSTGTFHRRKKEKDLPIKTIVTTVFGGLIGLTLLLFYQLSKAPGRDTADLKEIIATSFDIEKSANEMFKVELDELRWSMQSKKPGIHLAIARSSDPKANLKFFVASNLPAGVRLVISVVAMRGQQKTIFEGRFAVPEKGYFMIDTQKDPKKITPGEYYVFFVEDIQQPNQAARLLIERLPNEPRRIPSIREQKKLIISKRYVL